MEQRFVALVCAAAFAGLASVNGAPAAATPQPQAAPKPPKASPMPPPVLEGRVTAADGKAVENALVIASSLRAGYRDQPLTTRTDAKGAFRLQGKDAGPYALRVEARGWAATSLDRVRPGTALNVALTRGGAIEGVVRDGVSGKPVAGARLEARDQKSMPLPWDVDVGIVTALSDERGRYRIEGLSTSLQSVSARLRGYGSARKPDVRPGGLAVDLYLFTGGSVSGIVSGADGKPVDGALVQVEVDLASAAIRPERTRADGRFEIVGLAAGAFRLVARHQDFAPAVSAPLWVEAGGDQSADLVLEHGSLVSGRLTDAEGRPVPGRVVVADLAGQAMPRALSDLLLAEASSDGRFKLVALPSGDHSLSVTAPGYSSKRIEVQTRSDGREADLGDIALEAGLTIRGRVRDKAGAGIAGVKVYGFPVRATGPGMLAESRSEADGTFTLGGLLSGPYQIGSRAPGYGEAMLQLEAGASGVEIVLSPAGSVTGQAVDEENRPLTTYRISTRQAPTPGSTTTPGGMRLQDVSSPDGRFVVEDVGEGTHVLSASAPDRLTATVSAIRVVSGQATDVGRVRLVAGGAIRGSVVDTAGAPVAGAALTVYGPSRDFASFSPQAVSDAAGMFEVRGVPASVVELRASHPNFADGRVTGIDVNPAKGPAEAQIVLSGGGRVEGLVRRRDGRALTGVAVTIVSMTPDGVGSRTGPSMIPLREDGHFTSEHVPSGRAQVLLLNASRGPYSTAQSQEIEVRDGATTSVEFVARDILVSGRITRSGAPGAGLRLDIRLEQGFTTRGGFAGSAAAVPGPQRGTAVTRQDGTYEMIVDAPGKALASVQGTEGRTSLPGRTITIPDADAYSLDLDFGGIRVEGIVVDAETDEPLAEVVVFASPKRPRDGASGSQASSGPDGRFVLELDPGEYRVGTWAPNKDYARANEEVAVGDGAPTELRLALGRGSAITGRVVDATGRGAASLSVIATGGEGPQGSSGGTMTLPDGSFRITGLRPESHTLVARSNIDSFAVRLGITPGEKEVVLTLRPGARIRVQVLGEDQNPVDRAAVIVTRYQGARIGLGGRQSDASGIAELQVPAGSLEVTATKEKLEGKGTVTAAEGGVGTVVVKLAPSPER